MDVDIVMEELNLLLYREIHQSETWQAVQGIWVTKIELLVVQIKYNIHKQLVIEVSLRQMSPIRITVPH